MGRPPDDDYFNAPNERGILPSRPRPGYSQQPAPSHLPPQQNRPPGPAPFSRPGLSAGQEAVPQLDFPPAGGPFGQSDLSSAQNQGPFSQSGLSSSSGPLSQPGLSAGQRPFSQPGFASGQGTARQAGFPATQGPISRPGLPAGQGLLSRQSSFPPQAASAPQQGSTPAYPQQQTSWPGNFAPDQRSVSFPGAHIQQEVPPPQWQEQSNKPPIPPKEPEKPRSRKGLAAAITIVLVLLLVAAGASALMLLKQKGNTHTASSGKNIHPTATQSTSNAPSSYGQPTQAGLIWVVTITHVTTTTSSEFPPAANDTYLEISLTMKNVSATPQPVSSAIQFTLTGADGTKYSEALTDTNIRQTPDATVPAGQTLSAQLPYQVPKAKHTFTLTFAYGLINGSNASVSWQINV
ncbi:MAG TPA: DUF4352 domain-containing protein [Ktedonobacteraceae bacterium]|nr:DUF4352 domain-containing protein [Ktedonobacteraceae bacterium]